MIWPYAEGTARVEPKEWSYSLYHGPKGINHLAYACPECDTLNRLAARFCRSCRTSISPSDSDQTLTEMSTVTEPQSPWHNPSDKLAQNLPPIPHATGHVATMNTHLHYLVLGLDTGKVLVYNMLVPRRRDVADLKTPIVEILSATPLDLFVASNTAVLHIKCPDGDASRMPASVEQVYRTRESWQITGMVNHDDSVWVLHKNKQTSSDALGQQLTVGYDRTVAGQQVKLPLGDPANWELSPPALTPKGVVVFTGIMKGTRTSGLYYWNLGDRSVKAANSPHQVLEAGRPLVATGTSCQAIYVHGHEAPMSYPIEPGKAPLATFAGRPGPYMLGLAETSGHCLMATDEGLTVLDAFMSNVGRRLPVERDIIGNPPRGIGESLLFMKSNPLKSEMKSFLQFYPRLPHNESRPNSITLPLDGEPVRFPPVAAYAHWAFLTQTSRMTKLHILKPNLEM